MQLRVATRSVTVVCVVQSVCGKKDSGQVFVIRECVCVCCVCAFGWTKTRFISRIYRLGVSGRHQEFRAGLKHIIHTLYCAWNSFCGNETRLQRARTSTYIHKIIIWRYMCEQCVCVQCGRVGMTIWAQRIEKRTNSVY